MSNGAAACAYQQANVNNLEARLQDLYLQRDDANPPLSSDEKGKLGKQINKTREDLDKAKAALQQCLLINDPPPPVNPNLIILDIEVVNAVQRRGNLVRLTRGRSAMVRVFVSSGIINGYDSGYGPGCWAGVSGGLHVVDADNGLVLFDSTNPLNLNGHIVAQPTVAVNRNVADHSLNFRVPGPLLLSRRIRFEAHVFVEGHESDGGNWVADNNVTVEIPDRQRPQLIEPILIAETVSGNGVPPSMSEFLSTLQGATDRFPIPEFTVAPPRTLSTSRDLSTLAGWEGLLYDLNNWAGTSSQFEGIIAGLVSSTGSHGNINGIGTQRHFFFNRPKFVSEPIPDTFAHEMGHAFGLFHANCSGKEKDPDPRLPAGGRSDQPGANVRTGQIIPAGVGELQSYCDQGGRWPSVATYDTVYDNMPI